MSHLHANESSKNVKETHKCDCELRRNVYDTLSYFIELHYSKYTRIADDANEVVRLASDEASKESHQVDS